METPPPRPDPQRAAHVEPRAIVSLAQAGQPRSVGHLVAPALSVDARLTGEEVNRLFDENPAVNSVTMSHPGKPESLGVITRLGFYRAMTGRFGYGYSLYTRRPVAALANWNPLVVDAGDDVETVTALVLRQPLHSRREDIVVRARDGSVGTVSAVDLFEAIAGLYGHDAVHDTLTGLPNRFLLRERVQQALDALDGSPHPVGVILIDLDDFKFVNDTLGHAAGDALLLDFARRASALMRPEDTLARLGGDEFAILVPRMTQPSDASAIATRLVECLHQPFDTLGHQLRVGASMGIATATERGSADVLLRNADLAMYEAKREQPGGVRAFDPLMHARAVERLRLEHELKRAIVADELFLLYQPQVALDGGAIGVEALVRWRHPTLGELGPSRFIGLAEQSGLIFDLDAWVVRRACAEAREWSLPLPVSVNISARTLDSGLLAQVVGDALLDSGLAAARLELEVTERVAAVGASKAPETLAELRQWGVRIALDDFGTGYSALSQLSAYPLDTVKIDRSFISQLETRPAAETIVRAIIAMATALGLSVVAEGVETAEQLEFLRQNACHAAQGFLLARPVPAADVERAAEDAVTRGRRLATRLRAV